MPQENGLAAAQQQQDGKPSKADKKKERKKRAKQHKQQLRQEKEELQKQQQQQQQQAPGEDDDIIIEYVTAPVDLTSIFGDQQQQKQKHKPSQQQEADEDGDGSAGALHPGLGAGGAAADEDGQQQQQGGSDQPLDHFEAFKAVLERFMPTEAAEDEEGGGGGGGEDGQQQQDRQGGGGGGEDGQQQQDRQGGGAGDGEDGGAEAAASDADSDDGDGGAPGGPKLTKKQRKAMQLARIAELKRATPRPDVVEVWDVTAPDPHLLVYLKSYRNTVPVPRHWSQKRRYLQGKRGIEKPPFQLPAFIEATGISDMRQAYREKEDAKKLKQKQRDRMSAKTGKMDIDYAVLYDAFFRHQTRPKLTPMGDLYYEGKEYEADVSGARPGVLSAELKDALGMAAGAPPPWLINMQRYGPPPAYPNLRIPGLNAPIPKGAEFGYHPGGWGKPPVDEAGAPIYGDVFGADGDGDASDDGGVDKGARWGELESEPEESSEEEEEDEDGEGRSGEGEEEEDLDGGIATDATGLTSAGLASTIPGVDSPEAALNLRKGAESVAAGAEGAEQPQLFTVLEQRKAAVGQGLMGTDHVYVLPGAGGAGAAAAAAAGIGDDDADGGRAPRPGDKRKAGAAGLGGVEDVEVTLLPEELEGLDEAAVRALYEERAAEMRAARRGEDFSDLVAAQAAAQKRKIAQKAEAKAAKKAKGGSDFKF